MFTFINEDFKLPIVDYTPGTVFSVPRDDLLVSIGNDKVQNKKGEFTFYFDNYYIGTANSTTFKFIEKDIFYFPLRDYTPENIFQIPQLNVYGLVAPDIDVSAIISITMDDCVPSFAGIYDINVNRFIVRNVNSHLEASTANIDLKTELPYDSTDVTDTNVDAGQDDALWLTDFINSPSDSSEKVHADDTCINYDETGQVRINNDTVYSQLEVFNKLDLCVLTEETISNIDDKECAVMQQMTKVRPYRYEFIVEDVKDGRHLFEFDYWNDVVTHDYVPLNSFTLQALPEYDDGRVQVTPFTLTYQFILDTYTPNLVFSPILNADTYVPPTVVKLPPEPLFTWDGEMELVDITSSHQTGGYRYGTCSIREYALPKDIKQCVIVEETKYPEPGKTPWIDIPRPDPDPTPPSGDTYEIPEQEVYIMENTILVTLDDNLTEIHLDHISLSLNADNHAWQFSAGLIDPDQRTLIKTKPDGSAEILHVTINGYTWHVLVEKIQSTRTFGKTNINISGRGLTALLAKPYEKPSSVTQGADFTVQQLADQILPIGWTNTWSTVTWLVDGGAFTYQNKTPIEALKGIADDIGAMIVPARDSQTIEFKPRYPVLPWNFTGTIVDVAIPESVVLTMTEEPSAIYNANGVYVHGLEIGGELGFCRLNGTAGDILLQTVSNGLMTDVIGLRALGERLLAGQQEQPVIKSISTFMDGTIVPLIDVGTFVGITIDSVETKGIVNAVTITSKFGEVIQDITIGEQTPNSWVAFVDLLPKDPMLVATLASTDGTTSVMTLLDGGVVRVRGTGTVSNKYYIRSGEIVSDAPDQTQNNIIL